MDTARGTNKRNLSKQKKPSEKYLLASDRNALKKKKKLLSSLTNIHNYIANNVLHHKKKFIYNI